MDIPEILRKHGLLDAAGMERFRAEVRSGSSGIADAVSCGLLKEEDALRVLGMELGMEFVDLHDVGIDRELLNQFPARLIYRHAIFPLRRVGATVHVVTSNPFDLQPLDEAGAALGCAIEPALAPSAEVAKLIKRHLGVGSETIDGLLAQAADDEEEIELLSGIENDAELSEKSEEASVVSLVNEILLEAIESRASDVHLESQQHGLSVRYRIDGMLQPQPVPPEIHRFQAAIISRLKIMARLNIAEKRLPQDGRMKLKIQGREIDVRVSVIPMIHGESIVMRVLDKQAMVFDLRQIGMDESTYATYRRMLDLPHGIVLVTGPTGSGKTTTLYSSLIEINTPDVKIITTEDPVEYQLDGINQIQVHTKIGLTFGASLRSILRHDPDIVLIGEIRDLETAENAIQASLTGHLVFSTLHTNDSAGSFTRLVDMGVEPFLVASTVEGILAQRLVRRLCPACKKPFTPRRDQLPDDFPMERLAQATLFEGYGCRSCRQLGYRGRMGIYELLTTSEAIRQLAHDRASTWKIKQAAMEDGMVTLRQDGWRKVLLGLTSIDEVVRAAGPDLGIQFA